MALPGGPGRDHDLGALGCAASRRERQSRHHDLVQPLRTRCGRRLDAPPGRRARPRGPGIQAHPVRPTSWRGTHPRRGGAAHPYGEASISWRIEQDALLVDLVVPVGTTAELDIPGLETEELGHGAHSRAVRV
nr:alpha-L-rhamnosidase C-terminal domain-containing protein [Microbacterium sp. Se63.02b]